MADSLIRVAACPFCEAGRGVLAVDPAAVRALTGSEILDLRVEPAPPALVFDPDRPEGQRCGHLVELSASLGWELRRPPGRVRRGGGLVADWRHPLSEPPEGAGVIPWVAFRAVARSSRSRHPLRPRTPAYWDKTELDRRLPAAGRGRWSPWLTGDVRAQFAVDPVAYCREMQAGFAQFLTASGPGAEPPAGPDSAAE
jgi:hypothetical protein